MTMAINVILKLVLSPVIVLLCDLFSPYQINYVNTLQAIVIGLFIAIVNTAVEWLLFSEGTYWFTTILDFIVTLCVVFFGSMMFPEALVSTVGALSITIIVTVMEYFMHNWLWQHDWNREVAAK